MNYIQTSHEPLAKYSQYRHHFHSNYEVYYFLGGDADYMVEGTEYHLTPHSLLLLAPNVLHGVRVNTDADYVRCCLYFAPEDISAERRMFLCSCFPAHPRLSGQVIFYENLKEYHFELFFDILQRVDSLQEGDRAQYRAIYLEAFLAQIHLMCQERFPTAGVSGASPVVLEIMEYLNSHLAQAHTLDALSERFHISKYYMNRAFKQQIGTTIIDYLLFKRIVVAKQYLLNGDTAMDAAWKVGFGDYSSFYRSYKRVMGEPPSAIKKDSLENAEKMR